MRKIHVICCDPDATDSSSDEDDSCERRNRVRAKRLVREFTVPTTPKFLKFLSRIVNYSGTKRPIDSKPLIWRKVSQHSAKALASVG
ncbi:hypothetical protein IFM89_012514 [Coptis chinensis]|uniref:Uncharacterized protein n=1 Tax=Coptis chinensis TaxID=261450 RepID=A0A835I1X9_9MAGN|nr:hypothetical protein IFM89_012514 [Coptis chinensis]